MAAGFRTRTIDNETNSGPDPAPEPAVTASGPRGVTRSPLDNNADVGRVWQADELDEKVVVEGEEAGSVPDNSISTAKLQDGAVTEPKLGANAVSSAKLAAGAVLFANAAVFVSTEQTGTGAPQNIAHGLGAVPSAVLVVPTDLAPATTGDYTVTEGAHDATNVVVTVTASKKFKVLAWA